MAELLMEEEILTPTEISRVAGNWIDQPGTECFDPFLSTLGVALQLAGEKRAGEIKEMFTLAWRAWNVNLDQDGQPLPGDE